MACSLLMPLHRMARQTPDASALTHAGTTLSWRKFRDRVAEAAGWLASRGIDRGDRVALLARNDDRYLITILAIIWAGAVAVPLNLRWSHAELLSALEDCGASLLLVDGSRPDVDVAHICPAVGMDDLRASGTRPVTDAGRSDADLALLMYTGGTTGRSKGVMVSHAGLHASAASYATFAGGIGERMLQVAPLFHIAGINAAWGALLAGSRQFYLPTFDAAAVLAAIERDAITDIFLVPTMLQAVVGHSSFGDRDLSSLRRIVYGASPIAEPLLDRCLGLLPDVGFIQAYGMTELSPVATLLAPQDHYDAERRRSAGRATIMTEVRIVDGDDVERALGEVGEIVVRGGNVMLGYWGQPDATAEVLRGGWMHTGDLGRMDRDGFVHVVDRAKDMIISGGENVYSAEVESALSSHPKISRCAVIGVPHPSWGESVHAVLVPVPGETPTLEEVQAHCRATLAGYKIPRSLEIRADLPLSAAGKVLKSVLRQGRSENT